MTNFPLFFSYFSSSSSLPHYTAKARAWLGVVSSSKIPEKGGWKGNGAKTASFWPIFFLKEQAPKQHRLAPFKKKKKEQAPKQRCFSLFLLK